MKQISFKSYLDKEIGLYVHDTADVISFEIERDKRWFEHELLEHIANEHRFHGVIVDVGANIGNHSKFFMEYLVFQRMICVEPHVTNYNILRANTSGDERVELVRAACGAQPGECGLVSLLDRNYGMVKCAQGTGTKIVTVDDLCGGYHERVTLLKIDVEGDEVAVLQGAWRTLTTHRPMVYAEACSLDDLHKLMECLDSFNYTCTKFIDKRNPMFEFTPR